jgi:PKD repeat protein
MKRKWLRALLLLLFLGLFACRGGGDGGTPSSNGPSNSAPTAAFSPSCTLLACTFTDGSSDSDGSIASYSWNFGDNSPAVTTKDAGHTFAQAGTYTVTLTVTDNDGATDNVSIDLNLTNTPPTANFAFSCTDLACSFTNTSSDNDVVSSITAYNWTFGDQSAAVTTENATHTYAAAGTYSVALTVTDNLGLTGNVTKQVTVTAAQAGAPTAKFDVTCVSLDCTFVDQSTATGSVVTWAWDFGDGQTSAAQNPPVHHYSVTTLTTFTITLTVTSDGLSSTNTQSVPVAPPASTLNCVQGGAACVLTLPVPSTVKVTLVSSSCVAIGNQFVITAPVLETLFTDGCYAIAGSSFDLNGGLAFGPNTQLEAQVLSGLSGTSSLVTDPQLDVSGDFQNGWTLKFDDGAGGAGEPDFNDLIILIKATAM